MPTDIVRMSLLQLVRALDDKTVSSVEATTACLAQLHALQPTVHPAAVVFADAAQQQARDSDARRARGDVWSVVDGVPLSLKENLDLVGTASTLGLPQRSTHVASHDAVVVDGLRQAGAVFVHKSNVSQALLFHESRNPIYGETGNPYDVTRAPGGSSGGEGASIATGCSMGGIGTDIGGSIRVPAAWCGIAGLKPTVDRLSNRGSQGAIMGQEVIRGQLGPMAKTARDVALLLMVLDPLKHAARDPRVPPLPFALADANVRPLRVGFFSHDGIVTSSPAVVRAVACAVQALKDAGCTVVPYTPVRFEEAIFAYIAALSADRAKTLRTQLDAKDLDPALKLLWTSAQLPDAVRVLAAKIMGAKGDRLQAKLLASIGEKSVQTLWALTKVVREIAAAAFDSMANLDVLVCPAHATPAIQQRASRDFALAGAASMYFNLVNFPAGVVAVTHVRADECALTRNRTRLETRAAAVDVGSVGLPVGVQVVAKPWREDLVLSAMAMVEDGVAFAAR